MIDNDNEPIPIQNVSPVKSLTITRGNETHELTLNSIYKDENTFNNELNTVCEENLKIGQKSRLLPKIELSHISDTTNVMVDIGDGICTLTFLNYGAVNEVYKLDYNSGKTYILRITRLNRPSLKYRKLLQYKINSEMYGLIVQSYLHKKCPEHICNVYDFGRFTTVNGAQSEEGVYALLEYLPILCEEHMIPKKACNYNIVEFENLLLNNVFIGLFTALKCIHENRFVHLDIKPENIGFGTDKNVKLFDFGYSMYIPDHLNKNEYCVHNTGTKGTAAYTDYNSMIKDKICFKSDVWSAGIMLYEAWFKGFEGYRIKMDKLSDLGYKTEVFKLTFDKNVESIIRDMNSTFFRNIFYRNIIKVIDFKQKDDCTAKRNLQERTKIYGFNHDKILKIKTLIKKILTNKIMTSDECLNHYNEVVIKVTGGNKRTIRRTTRKCTSKNSRKSRRCKRK
jgi:serine/threonine protein kinase